ncbi:hypothetical protein [Streptomyces palmae]|uniref:Uncharacterized protein n=1 Tax=Streptomyces palmae TaxID=1701085 RepID=A0A4Z0GTS9_9ACTN|nr:hypothetical protein [Streptomyces palmae]TGA99699.1 hypothetical protein E4099_22220 [Streptomyces palmae]
MTDYGPAAPRQRLMTLRVYWISPKGIITEERPEVEIRAGDHLPPLMSHAYPPCACLRCRDLGRSPRIHDHRESEPG